MCREKQNMRNRIFHYRMNGVITVEMSYILPMVFWTFLAVIYMIFYFHDKNIMIGAAAETAVVGAQLERKPDEKDRTDLEGFYQQRIAGKLILFPETAAEAEILKKNVIVTATAEKGRMGLTVEQRAAITKPEEKIRKKRLMENGIESERGENDENNDSGGERDNFE